MICKLTQCPHVFLLVNCNGHRCFGGYRYMYVKGSESFHPEIIGHVIFLHTICKINTVANFKSILSMVGVIWGEVSIACKGQEGLRVHEAQKISIPHMEGIFSMNPPPPLTLLSPVEIRSCILQSRVLIV